jgi:hypothetical protein
MADEGDGVMVSEDSVVRPIPTKFDFQIPLDDPIEDVRQLVGWMTREKGCQLIYIEVANFARFKIHAGNMKSLARLSDKYMIDHLHHDICVPSRPSSLT